MVGYPPRLFDERFWEKVDRTGECWVWTANRNKAGYGRIASKRGSMEYAHRLSYMMFHGDPGELSILHDCDNPPCVNPAHLKAGTQKDNLDDMDRRGRRICLKGEAAPAARLTEAQVLEIRASPLNQTQLARLYGLDPSTVSNIMTRKLWKHI